MARPCGMRHPRRCKPPLPRTLPMRWGGMLCCGMPWQHGARARSGCGPRRRARHAAALCGALQPSPAGPRPSTQAGALTSLLPPAPLSQLCEALRANTTVISLDLSANHFTDEGGWALVCRRCVPPPVRWRTTASGRRARGVPARALVTWPRHPSRHLRPHAPLTIPTHPLLPPLGRRQALRRWRRRCGMGGRQT